MVNTDSVQEPITEGNPSQEISNEDLADTMPPFKEPYKGDDQKDTSTTSEDSNNEGFTGNSSFNNTPTTTERQHKGGQRLNNP